MRGRTACSGTRAREGAMTLVEIMVVVVIMGIIAGVVAMVVTDKVERARIATAKMQLATLRDAVIMFQGDQAFYPKTLQDLVTRPSDARVRNWPPNGYMPSIPLDPWGNEYVYVTPGLAQPFEIVCLGADGVEGGEDGNADIESWKLSASAGDRP